MKYSPQIILAAAAIFFFVVGAALRWLLPLSFLRSDEALIFIMVVGLAGLTVLMIRYLSGRSEIQFEFSDVSSSLHRQIRELRQQIAELSLTRESSIDVNRVTSDVREFVEKNLTRDITSEIDKRYREFLEKEGTLSIVRERLEKLSSSLDLQLKLQVRKANLNLIIGIMIAIFGFGVLGYLTVFGYIKLGVSNDLTIEQFAFWYIPKLTFVLVLEVFSYFFLNLYRSGLNEIKFFQNEITNLECRIAAVYASLGAKDGDALRLTIEKLASTERNFVLKKGERNVTEATKDYAKSQLAELLSDSIKALKAN